MEQKTIEKPLVSIITVNYNQSRVTRDLLISLRRLSYAPVEIIVVDNASPNDSPDWLTKDFPEITLLKSTENRGFAGGNNLGIRAARGEFLLFINNDTEVGAGLIEPMVELFQTNASIGMISPKIRFYHTPDTIQYAGYTPMSPYTMRQNLIGCHQVDKGQFDEVRETFSVHGAAMMVPRRVIEEVGLMAEVFFLYYEEHDWSARIRKAGYKIYYQPRSLVMHKESISTGKESPLKIYYISRNRIVYARRNSTGWKLLVNLIYLNVITIPKSGLHYLLQGRFDLLQAFLRAMLWNLRRHNHLHESPRL
jgi:GT2 family glycosyltransferase